MRTALSAKIMAGSFYECQGADQSLILRVDDNG